MSITTTCTFNTVSVSVFNPDGSGAFLDFYSSGSYGTSFNLPASITCTSIDSNPLTVQTLIDALNSLFSTYFQFDEILFGEIVGWNLLAFVTCHGLGRLMQVWRKAM